MKHTLPLYGTGVGLFKKSSLTATITALCLFVFALSGFAQGPGSPYVDAGEDIALACGEDCAELTADFLDTGETDQYRVMSIPYDTPYPFSGLANPISVNQDDVWSNIINLPFDFCFFGDVKSQVVIGSNGIISFNTNQAGGYCSWVLGSNDRIPTSNIHENSIMLFQDIDPRYGNNQIGWELFGDAPNRALVVSFFNVPYYNFANPNNSATSTFQMVLYETTNAIEFFVESKPNPHNHISSPINGGLAVLGIQNATGNQGYTPPGRNTSVWEATREAWRFMPSGESNVDFAWLNEDGEVIGTEATITVCPTETETTYTARAIWTNCNGDEVLVTDEVTVTKSDPFTMDLGGDQTFCDVPEYQITAELTGADPNDATFLWSTGETTQSIIVTESGTYSVEVAVDDCVVTDSVTIDLGKSPEIDLGEDRITCFNEPEILDATPTNYPDPSVLNYQWSKDGEILEDETEPTLEVFETGIYSVLVIKDDCFSTDSIAIIAADDLIVDVVMDGYPTSGRDIEVCPNEPHLLRALTEETEVSFQWFLNGDPIAGATSDTLEIALEDGTMGTQTYSVEISSGACIGSDSIDVRLYPGGRCVISQGLSPNGDGFNDNLDLTFLSDRTGIRNLQIFNRYGTVVYEQNNYKNQWFGQSKDGKELPTGTYYYVIDLDGDDPVYGRQATGWIYVNQKTN